MNTRKRPAKRNRGKETRSRKNTSGAENHASDQNSGHPGKRQKPSISGESFRQEAESDTGQRRKRDDNWLFGSHVVLAALANPARRCHRLCLTTEAFRRLEADLREIAPTQLVLERASRREISDLLPLDAVHQGIALQCDPLPDPALENVLALHADGDSIIVVLDQITDPHNVGAILRSAAGFGAHAVIMPERNAPPASGSLAKSASGALELLPLVRVGNLARTLEQLADAGYWRIGLEATARQTLAESRPEGRTAIVMGAEGSGLRRLTGEKCDLLCRLPMVEAARLTSLNVSNAAAIALYELFRA